MASLVTIASSQQPAPDPKHQEDIDSGTEIHSDSCSTSDDDRHSTDSALQLDSDPDLTNETPKPFPRKKKNQQQMKTKPDDYFVNLIEQNCELRDEQIIERTLPMKNIQKFEEFDEVAILNITSEFGNEELVEFYTSMVKGMNVPVDNNVSLDSRPSWLDMDKFKLGQKFATSHLFCINFAEMISLFMLFSARGSLEPLIYSGKSHTPFSSFQRYLSTLTRVKSWYEEDVWDCNSEARKNMLIVRGMHKNIKSKLDGASREEIEQSATLGDDEHVAVWSTLKNELLDDFRGSCPMASPGTCPFSQKGIWFNQSEMSFTQFGFVGLVVTYPEYFALANVSEKELEGFIHLWRGLGYLLGIKDEFNFCNGSLESVRNKTRMIIDRFAKPNFRNIDSDWEHMSRCLTEGISYYVPGVSFEVSLLYLCDIIKVHTPRLRASLTIYQSFIYNLIKFVFKYWFYVPGVLTYHNNLLFKTIKHAQNYSRETLDNIRSKTYSYTQQDGKLPHK